MSNTLNWKNRNVNIDGQRIYKATIPIDPANLPPVYTIVGPTVEQYVDTDVIVGTTYYYRIAPFVGPNYKLSAEITVTAAPTNGPGPSTLTTGDTEAGFYGEVAGNIFVTRDQLRVLLSFDAGISLNNDAWLKCMNKGETIFIAKMGMGKNIKYQDLIDRKLVYGTTGQQTIVKIRGQRYSVELLSGADISPSTATPVASAPLGTSQSDWDRIMYRLCSRVVSTDSASKLANYTQAELGTDQYGSMTKTADGYTGTAGHACRAVYNGSYYNIEYLSYNSNTSTYATAWRPVLRHIPW